MKIIIIIFSFLFCFQSSLFSQSKKTSLPKTITITGFVPDSIAKQIGDTLQIFVNKRYDKNVWHEGAYQYVRIVKNKFSVTIQPQAELAYLQIKAIPQGFKTIYLNSILYDAFLVHAGDSIHVEFTKYDEALFTGKGSEMIQYQNFVGKLVLDAGAGLNKYVNEIDRIPYWKALADKHLHLCMDSLNRIKPLISGSTYKVLLYNTTSAILQNHVSHLTSTLFHNRIDTVHLNAVRSEMIWNDIQQRGFACPEPVILDYSAGYISYLSYFQKKFVEVMNGAELTGFTELYSKITNDYTGVLRDKILTNNIVDTFENLSPIDFIAKALSLSKDPESTKRLRMIYKAKTPGAEVPDYIFSDLSGHQIHLKDLRGKLLVIETYFNGCSGCVGLSTRMHPIVESYANNKKVIFISLSVDKRRQNFLEGVATGKYGSKSTMYMNTNGLGWEHPICIDYQWNSYPQMLFIDKSGRLLSAEKTDPKGENNRRKLIAFINSHL